METRLGPQTPFEVYCFDCRVTFPVGTRRCVHCGRPITAGPSRGAPTLISGGQPEAEELELPGPMSARRLGGMSLWVLLALGAALTRFCTER